jgi:hypothetical protein
MTLGIDHPCPAEAQRSGVTDRTPFHCCNRTRLCNPSRISRPVWMLSQAAILPHTPSVAQTLDLSIRPAQGGRLASRHDLSRTPSHARYRRARGFPRPYSIRSEMESLSQIEMAAKALCNSVPSFNAHHTSPCPINSPIRHRIGQLQSSGIFDTSAPRNCINALDVTPKLRVNRTSPESEKRLFCTPMTCQHRSVCRPYRCPPLRNPCGRKRTLRSVSNRLNAESAGEVTRVFNHRTAPHKPKKEFSIVAVKWLDQPEAIRARYWHRCRTSREAGAVSMGRCNTGLEFTSGSFKA